MIPSLFIFENFCRWMFFFNISLFKATLRQHLASDKRVLQKFVSEKTMFPHCQIGNLVGIFLPVGSLNNKLINASLYNRGKKTYVPLIFVLWKT